jgi:hypothetical protein
MSVRFVEDLSVDGNVGIGTTSPSSTLTINQTDDNGIKLIGYDDRDDASANIYIDSGGHLKINNTNGSASGYIIIEAENYLNLRASSFVYFTSNVRVYDSNQFGFGSGNDLVIQHDGSNSYISQGGTGNLYIQQNTNDADMIFQCDNGSGGTSIYMMLDGSESRISTKVNNRFDDNVKLELGTSGDLDLLHDGSNSYIHHNGAGSLYMKADTGDINIINYTNDKDIIFQSDDGSGGVTPYLTLDGSTTHSYFSAGNVGIGTSNPAKKLHISDSSRVDIKFTKVGSEEHYIRKDGDFLRFRGHDDSAVLFELKNNSNGSNAASFPSGNLGIGTTSPAYKLDVSSGSAVGARISTSGFTNLDLVSSRTSGNLGGVRFKQDIDAHQTAEFLGLHGGGFEWKTGNGTASPSSKMILNTSGNVGIGTSSPGFKFVVNSSTADTVAKFESTDAIARLELKDDDDSAYIGTQNNKAFIGMEANATGTNNLIVTSDGNVGIGTTSPVEALNVGNNGNIRIDGNGSGRGIFASSNGSNNTFSLTRQDGVNTADLSISGYGGVGITGGRTSSPATSGYSLYVANSGNIGIGTTAPAYNLDVQTSSNIIARFESTDNKGAIAVKDDDTTAYISAENSRIGFGTSPALSTQNITMLTSNNFVGIGVTSPSEKLDVAGDIKLSGDIELGHASDTTIARASAGKVTIEGNEIQTTNVHHHFLNSGFYLSYPYSRYIPLNGSISEQNVPGSTPEYTGFIWPYDGYVKTIWVRSEANSGNTLMQLYKGANGSANGGTAMGSVTEACGAHTSVEFDFTGVTNSFSQGEGMAIKIDPTNTSQGVIVTIECVFNLTT